jgi:hypothetical protein
VRQIKNIECDEKKMKKNTHFMNTRDKIERQQDYLKKRKAKENLSKNRNIKKTRD